MTTGSAKSRERVARNFIKSYGRTRFRELLAALARGESGQRIADGFGKPRARVSGRTPWRGDHSLPCVP